MKIFFVLTGIGFGHAIREEAIIKEVLKRDYKTKIKIATYGRSYEFFKSKYAVVNIKGWIVPDGKFNFAVRRVVAANITAPVDYPINFLRLVNEARRFKP